MIRAEQLAFGADGQIPWESLPQVDKDKFHKYASTIIPAEQPTSGAKGAINCIPWEALSKTEKDEVLQYVTNLFTKSNGCDGPSHLPASLFQAMLAPRQSH
jgi:hypothetical protein